MTGGTNDEGREGYIGGVQICSTVEFGSAIGSFGETISIRPNSRGFRNDPSACNTPLRNKYNICASGRVLMLEGESLTVSARPSFN